MLSHMMNGRDSSTGVIVFLINPEGIQIRPSPEDNMLSQLAVFELHLLNTFEVWHDAAISLARRYSQLERQRICSIRCFEECELLA